ncbi:myo-inositol-1(or 4)-monophosphatase [Atopostipes suicloacalis DSM 15692]|uniref:Myo-inositol-1(Or 4)-monophosphatase n=1 Tax=Atopostipes suicloacalis DSM 15692 TaxID=1121025 RepID=A0A1M4VXU8_9LACT|nr:inositol monophosphatase family protein [Atopostipes suicloacalis]SHE73787.1 myo-inositol-1(or 4)-monophosphatase [Atopostipes suicloacalis DSM 15692]
MQMTEKRDVLIKEWLKEAATEIKEALQHDLEVEVKSRANDLVTQMDRKIEKELVQKINQHFPNDLIISEEGFGDHVSREDFEQQTVWFLDPIDGTLNFVLQNENYAVMLAVYEKGIGKQAYIYDITHNKLYWGIKDNGVYCNDQPLPKMKDLPLDKGLFASNSMFLSDQQVSFNAEITKRAMGVRTIGSAGLESVELTKGSTVAYVSYGLKPWDIAPGLFLVEENGGVVTQFDGSRVDLLNTNPTIMATPTAQKEITKLLS